MKTLGGSLFIRNAIKYDYCVREALMSIMDVCDKIVLLDCESDDGTTEMLRKFCSHFPKVEFVEGVKWECADNYARLAILANQAIDRLDTDWHFMIQGDEVLHEISIPFIRDFVQHAPDYIDTAMIRRVNLWGDMQHHIRYDLPTPRKPVSDAVIRIGRKNMHAVGDAESLEAFHCYNAIHAATIFHYGFVRKNEVQKVIDMQTWFHGKDGDIDKRVIAMKEKDGVFRPEAFFKKEELADLCMDHPVDAKEWVEERRSLFPPVDQAFD